MTHSSFADATASTPPAAGKPAIAFAVVGLAAATTSLDTSVNVAFPYISQTFALNIGIAWVVAAYVLPLASLVVIFGKLGDLFACHRLLFQVGLALSAVSFGFYGLFPGLLGRPADLPWLLGARALQGIGAAMTLSCSVVLATSLYDECRRTSVIAIYSMALSVGQAIAPIVGAWLIDLAGWRAVFWFRAPIMLLTLAASFALPRSLRAAPRGRLDWTGALLLFVLVGAIVALVTKRQVEYYFHVPSLAVVAACLALAAIAGFAFFRHERRFAEPIIDPKYFRRFDFSLLIVIGLLIYLAGFGALLWIPYLPGAPPLAVGWMLALALAGITVGSMLARPIARGLGTPSVGLVGIALVTIGTALVALADIRWLVAFLFIQNLGVGLFQVVVIDSLSATLPVADRGVAGSLAQLVRMIGLLLGAAVLAAIPPMLGIADSAAFATRMRASFGVAAIGLATVLLLSLARWRQLWGGGAMSGEQ